MAAHRRRPPAGRLARRAVVCGGLAVPFGLAGAVPVTATFATVADAAPMPPVDWPQATVVAAEQWTLDLPATFELAGLTGPAPLALVATPAAPIYTGTPGWERPYPVDFDHVEAVRAHAEREANRRALARQAGQPDDQQRIDEERLARACDPLNTDQEARRLCDRE